VIKFFDQIATSDPPPQWYNKLFIALSGLTSSGTTADRPTDNLWVGRNYFDTTLGFSIHWNGGAWVDGAGTVV
jgi:hypothetical protein